jgi:DNA-binding response OmpR family regulator
MRRRKPDLLLLDLMMPQLNGWDIYRAMKSDETLSSVPVIVITARVPSSNRIIIEDLPPVDDYITKPFDVERLIRSIQGFLSYQPKTNPGPA